jgi:hypothetical protein
MNELNTLECVKCVVNFLRKFFMMCVTNLENHITWELLNLSTLGCYK